jgi:hypothetical protein
MFNPGSRPSLDPKLYPSMVTLCETLRLVYVDLCVVARETDASALAVDNPFEPARADFPTAGDFVAYLLSSHFAYHLGQLVAWRAAAGFQPLQRPGELVA